MKTILLFATVSLVMWLTLGSNEKQREYDDGKVFEEILDREKRNVMSQSGVCMIIFLLFTVRIPF